jgi:chromosome partitioning protein
MVSARSLRLVLCPSVAAPALYRPFVMGSALDYTIYLNRPMVIAVANLESRCGKSICAVNLACELADIDSLCADRWQGKYSVVLVDGDINGTATRCCSGGRLPVSSEYLGLEDLKDLQRWVQRIRTIKADYVVLDGPSSITAVTLAIVGVSDLVVVPCSVSRDLMAIPPMMKLIREARSARSDGRPECILVPTCVNVGTTVGRKIDTALRKLGERVGPVIHYRPAFVDALSAGRWIGDFAPDSSAHGDIKALAASVGRT